MKNAIVALSLIALTACGGTTMTEQHKTSCTGGLWGTAVWTYDVYEASVTASAMSFSGEEKCHVDPTVDTFQCTVDITADTCQTSHKSFKLSFNPVTNGVKMVYDGSFCGPALEHVFPCQ